MKQLHNFKIKAGETEHEIVLKALGRRDREDLAVIYNAEYGKALSKGLSTFASLRKAALDAGGFWSDDEVNRADQILREISKTSNEIQKLTIEEKDTKELETTLNGLLAEFEEYKKPETALYSRSAEYEAEKNSVIWCVLHMALIKRGDKLEAVFPGVSTESRLDYYYECADAEDKDLEKKVFDKAYLCFHHAIKNNETDSEVFKLLTDEPGTDLL